MPRVCTIPYVPLAIRTSALLVVVIAMAVACSPPKGVKAVDDSSESSSSGAAGSSSTGGSTTASETTTTTGGGSSTGMELPDGCGDGVVEPGQYNCFVSVPLPYLGPEHNKVGSAAGLDIDGDGREELLVEGIDPSNAVLFLEGGAFDFGPPATSGVWDFIDAIKWDWDRDGRLDLVIPSKYPQGEVTIIRSLGQAQAEGEIQIVAYEYFLHGRPVPIDVDGDGELEFFVAVEWPSVERGGHLRKRVAGEWVDIGPVLSLPGCGAIAARAYADFDEDGFLDVVVHDSVTGCKPYPTEYDPAFHRVAVFRSDSETGLLEPTGTFPTGGMGEHGMWGGDFDDDGHQDVAIQIGTATAISLLRGRGDGTLTEPMLITQLGGTDGAWGLNYRERGDFDGDEDLEWLGGSENGDRWVLESLVGDPSVIPLPSWIPTAMAVADFNGDGASDFLDPSPDTLGDKYVLLSMP